MKDLTAVILCGGQGVRYQNVYVDSPKALAPIGNMPILWHLLKYFTSYGIRKFVLCLGSRGDEIKRYVESIDHEPWEMTCVDTGPETPTGERVYKVKDYVDSENFMVTYVDGLSDIDLNRLHTFYIASGKIAALTAVRPRSQYGILEIREDNLVSRFDEKPKLPFYINGGFFMFNSQVFNYMAEGDILEEHTFSKLIADRELVAYRHEGFWKSMDTFKENMQLNDMWNSGVAEWRKW